MVTITNGISTFEVSKGAFDGIFSKQGYILVGDPVVHAKDGDVVQKIAEDDVKKDMEQDNDPELTEDEMFAKDFEEKPMAKWSKSELKRYAALSGISLAGTESFEDAKKRVKEAIDSK